MKNLRNFALAAFALLGFAACQQEEFAPEIKNPTHTVTFVAGAPETKTTVDISDGKTAKFAWTKADESRFTVYENGTKKATTVTAELGKDEKMTVKATFEGSTAPEIASYVAVVNKSNATQIMSAEAYDEDADILVSRAVSTFDGENGVMLQFKREVAIAKMTLKGLDAGEVVNMVTVSSTADIAGKYDVNGWASPAKTSLEISSALYMGGEGYSIVANASGEAVVWFTCIPQDAATLTVKVEAADGDTYTKEFSKPITLTRGDVKAFGVAMTKDAKVPSSYTIEFNSTVGSPELIDTKTKASTFVVNGTDYLADQPASNITYAYYGGKASGLPLRIGKSGDAGSITLALSEAGKVQATRIILSAKQYSSGKTKAIGVNGSDKQQPGNNYTDLSYDLDGTTISSIKLDTDGYIYVKSITVEYAGDPTVPKLSVTPTSKTWASDNKDAAVFTVTTNTAGEKDWTVSPTTLDWASVTVDKTAGTITVTPNGANTENTPREATLTVKHSAGTLSETITLTQRPAGEETVEKTSGLQASTTATAMNSYISYKNSEANTYSDPMRIYKDATFTISATNAVITKVEFTCDITDKTTAGLTGGTVTVDSGATSSMSKENNVVTYTITGSTTSFAVKASAQFRVSGLKVTYKKVN